MCIEFLIRQAFLQLFVGNVDGTYTLVINMLNSEDQDTKLYCLNLLIDFTKSETMLSAFIKSVKINTAVIKRC